ncbi:MAG: hypothetical protein GKR88_19410 [Flavobacteriaceae bacterium]|nr:MAG: hypothetical protein GKR88_19410 [Flavobacteriaceae bacterium]
MNKQHFPYKNVQQYLDTIGVLQNGTASEISQARKTFRKLYLKQYRKRYAQNHSSVNIVFSNAEKHLLKQLAMENGKKLASFIKAIALNTINGKQQLGNTSTNFSEIKRLFSLCYDMVETLQFENEYPQLKASYDKLEQLFNQIEPLLNDY